MAELSSRVQSCAGLHTCPLCENTAPGEFVKHAGRALGLAMIADETVRVWHPD